MKADKEYYKRAMEDMEIQKLEKLSDLAKRTKFWELLSTYLGRVKGAALIPLSYPVQEHEEVMLEIQNTDYGSSIQERLIVTTALSRTHYELDNQALYNTFKPLVVGRPGWSFVKKFEKQKDGRKFVLTLKMHKWKERW